MKPPYYCRFLLAGLFATAMLYTQHTAFGVIVGPYAPDPATLHLYHLDESATPSVDSATGGTNLVGLLYGATLGNASYSGFGNAVNTVDGGQDSTAASGKDAAITASAATPPGNVSFPYCNPATGAFTLEAIVWIGFDPSKNLGGTGTRNTFCQIMTCESGANGNRIFQFRICPKGVAPGGTGNPATAPQPLLTFENIRMVDGQNQNTIFATIPITGPDAILSNNWYHVAVTYNGVPNTANNLQFYWTLLDPSRAAANPIPITSTTNMLNGVDPLGTATTPFVIGNTARNITTAGNNFLGMIDEVRISKIARATNGMMFCTASPVVLVSPVGATVVQGDSAAFSVMASGAPTLAYQWRLDGTNLPGATSASFSIAAVQAANAGTYDVVVTNTSGSVTSAPANLTLRTPANLTWIGSASTNWDTTSVDWATNGDTFAETVYTERDDVTFNAAGSAVPVVALASPRSPHSVTVSADGNYTLTTTNGSTIGGLSQLLKAGNGTLILDVDCPITGPATIQSGTVQLGNFTGRGTLGFGPVTNNASLVVNRTGSLSLTNWLVGAGSLTNNATNTITVSGPNLMSGPITLNAGTLVLANAQARGNTTQYILNAAANATGPTQLRVGGGVTFGPSTSLSFLGTSLTPDYRCTLSISDSTNTFGCGMVLDGAGSVTFSSDGPASNSLFRVTAPSINSPGFTGQLLLRGVGNGVMASQLNLGGKISKTDSGTWTISSTGNSWVATDVAAGTLQMGANNVLPSTLTLNLTATTAGALLDLAGFNQSVDTLTGPGTIANSSTVADSTFTAHPSGVSLFAGVIKDSAGAGTHKVGLTVSSGTLSLEGTNTYTGPTVVLGGSLQLVLNGCISNTASIYVASGAAVDASTRSDGTFTVNPGQTLKGDGAFNVTGNLASAGTIELKLSKSGATLANDSVNVSGSLTYCGTLVVDLTASPGLTTSDTFPLFTAGGGFSGAFTEVIPGPGFGLAWDTSTLATDGTLRVMASTVPTTGTNLTAVVAANQLNVSWPSSYVGWRLQWQTNAPGAGLGTNWVYVPDSSVTNQVFFPISTTAGSVFFRMIYP